MVEHRDSKGKGAAMVPYLDQVFGDDGIFPLAGYAPREGQIALAHAVNLSIREGTPVLAEAGTGVGKSFGYLVPAIWHVTQGAPALLAGRLPVDEDPEDEAEEDDTPRALIVTAGITLQEQLTRKDIPTLQRILPWRFTAALAKGRGNYLCLDRLADARAASLDLSFATTDQEREQWATLDAWASATATGDFSELHQEPLPYHRHLVTISSDDCTGKHCPSFASCHFEKARRNIAKAQVIVANYHLLFAHLNLVAEFGRGILPRFDIVVFDEAHAAPSIAREFFGFLITPAKVRHIARFLVPAKRLAPGKRPLPILDADLHQEVGDASGLFFGDLDALRTSPAYRARLRAPSDGVAWEWLDGALARTIATYDNAVNSGRLDAAQTADLGRATRRGVLMRSYLNASMRCADFPGAELVYSLEEERGGTVVHGRRLHPGPVLREALFASSEVRTTIATSATLATAPGPAGFAFPLAELGAEGARTLTVETPFDYPRQGMLCIPEGLPDPKGPTFPEDVGRWVVRCVEAARGRTLGLFSSRRVLLVAAEMVRAAVGDRYAVLVQGEAPRSRLIDAFKADTSSVLLGTKSFWAGVDVPGEALSLVVIDRIPFDTPDDPILDALTAKMGRRTFQEYSIPRASIDLKQGAGRLIRSVSDRGVVVILDRRILARWASTILDALPPFYRSRQFEHVNRFFTAMSAASAPVEAPDHA